MMLTLTTSSATARIHARRYSPHIALYIGYSCGFEIPDCSDSVNEQYLQIKQVLSLSPITHKSLHNSIRRDIHTREINENKKGIKRKNTKQNQRFGAKPNVRPPGAVSPTEYMPPKVVPKLSCLPRGTSRRKFSEFSGLSPKVISAHTLNFGPISEFFSQ